METTNNPHEETPQPNEETIKAFKQYVARSLSETVPEVLSNYPAIEMPQSHIQDWQPVLNRCSIMRRTDI